MLFCPNKRFALVSYCAFESVAFTAFCNSVFTDFPPICNRYSLSPKASDHIYSIYYNLSFPLVQSILCLPRNNSLIYPHQQTKEVLLSLRSLEQLRLQTQASPIGSPSSRARMSPHAPSSRTGPPRGSSVSHTRHRTVSANRGRGLPSRSLHRRYAPAAS